MRGFLAGHWIWAVLWVLALSLCAFCAMGLDKRKARRGAWRTPERVLWLLALAGGAPGGCLGMYAFHHKTRHWQFRFGFPLLALLDLGLLAWIKMV